MERIDIYNLLFLCLKQIILDWEPITYGICDQYNNFSMSRPMNLPFCTIFVKLNSFQSIICVALQASYTKPVACTAGAPVCFSSGCERGLSTPVVVKGEWDVPRSRGRLALSPRSGEMTFITQCPGGKKPRNKSQERLLRRLLNQLLFFCRHVIYRRNATDEHK